MVFYLLYQKMAYFKIYLKKLLESMKYSIFVPSTEIGRPYYIVEEVKKIKNVQVFQKSPFLGHHQQMANNKITLEIKKIFQE